MNSGERWYCRNNFDDNYDYTIKILKKYNIDNYHFIHGNYGNTELIVKKDLKKYKLEIYQNDFFDKDLNRYETESYMIIKRCEVRRGGQKHCKEYMVEKKRVYEDCIYNAIKWISKNSELC